MKRTRYSYIEQHSQTITNINWEHELERFTQFLQTTINDYKCRRALLSLPTEYIESQRRPLANTLSAEEMLEMAYLEFEQLYPNGHNYYFDFDVINGNELLLVTLLKQRVEKLLSMFAGLNVQVIWITTNCAAERLAQDGLHACA